MSVLNIWTRVIQMRSVRTRSVPLTVRVKTDSPETGMTVQVGMTAIQCMSDGFFPPTQSYSDSDSKHYSYSVLCRSFSTAWTQTQIQIWIPSLIGYCTHFRDGSPIPRTVSSVPMTCISTRGSESEC